MSRYVLDLMGEIQIDRFLSREARLLDELRWADWLALCTEDIHYWMPVVDNRFSQDPQGGPDPNRMALYDDHYRDLERRVVRFCSRSAWGEDPRTRQLHLVSNVEVDATERPEEWRVRSVMVNVRNRGQYEQESIAVRRDDVLRSSGGPDPHHPLGELKLCRRTIHAGQSVLLSKNLNTLL